MTHHTSSNFKLLVYYLDSICWIRSFFDCSWVLCSRFAILFCTGLHQQNISFRLQIDMPHAKQPDTMKPLVNLAVMFETEQEETSTCPRQVRYIKPSVGFTSLSWAKRWTLPRSLEPIVRSWVWTLCLLYDEEIRVPWPMKSLASESLLPFVLPHSSSPLLPPSSSSSTYLSGVGSSYDFSLCFYSFDIQHLPFWHAIRLIHHEWLGTKTLALLKISNLTFVGMIL